MKTHPGAPSPLQGHLLRDASFPPGAPQADALRMTAVPLVPEIQLLLAEDPTLLWARLEAEAGTALPAPFWATAWAGGRALARYVLDHPEQVAGRRVLDLATGSGLVGIAAARAGAQVTANDIDAYALAALEANATANGVRLAVTGDDLTGGDGGDAEVVLAGDALYDAAVAARVLPFLERVAARGATVLLGEPGRGHLPDGRFTRLATYRTSAGTAEDMPYDWTGVLTLS